MLLGEMPDKMTNKKMIWGGLILGVAALCMPQTGRAQSVTAGPEQSGPYPLLEIRDVTVIDERGLVLPARR